MKKVIFVGIVILLSVAVTFYQIQIIRRETLQTFTEVVVLSHNMEAGELVQEKDLEMGRISSTWYSGDYCTSKSQVVGKTLVTDYGKFGILSNKLLTETVGEKQLTNPENAITTLKFLPEEALCWNLSKGDIVRVYHIDPLFEAIDMGQVTVKAVYDNNLKDDGMPIYLLVESERDVIREIVRLREAGRFEVILENPDIAVQEKAVLGK